MPPRFGLRCRPFCCVPMRQLPKPTMQREPLSRRDFLQETATGAAAVAAVAAFPETADAAADSDFSSQWQKANDRAWLGAEYWANPLQDWRINQGRIECTNAAANRNVHLLTRQL